MASGAQRTAAAPAPSGPAAPVTVIVGEEELLVERAVSAAVALAAAAGAAGTPGDIELAELGAVDVHDVTAAGLGAGELAGLTAPSLFGGGCVVVVRSAQDAVKDLAAELVRLASAPPPEVFLILTHAGGAKNKALLANLLSAGARRVDCPSIKRFSDRMDFLRGEFRQAGRKADDAGLRALLDAVGNDLRDLAAECSQLSADTTGVINQAAVAPTISAGPGDRLLRRRQGLRGQAGRRARAAPLGAGHRNLAGDPSAAPWLRACGRSAWSARSAGD